MAEERKAPKPGASKAHSVTKAQWDRFLTKLIETSNVQLSLREAGISSSYVYRRKKVDPEFRAQWEIALRIGYWLLEMEMLRRARFGDEQTIMVDGQAEKVTHRHDNRLAEMLLKRNALSIEDEGAGNETGPADPEGLVRRMREALRLVAPGGGAEA